MLTRNDLDEAVKSGIITAAQAESLAALPAKRHETRQAQTLRDERFVFMKSFNEFFIALGIVLLGIGLTTAGSGETRFAVAMSWAFPAIVWGLAEYLTAIRRYALPSIVLAVLFTFAMVMLAGQYISLLPIHSVELDYLPSFLHGESLMVCLALLFASIAFYLRFRLPFSLLLIVGSAIPLIIMVVDRAIGLPDTGVLNIVLLAIGLIVFAAALRFDMSDRERLTRRSDCAFWLMLAAAPLIVHPVVSLISSLNLADLAANVLTLAAIAGFILIALIVDRRAFLVSSLIYVGASIISGIGAIAGEGNAPWATLVVIGGAVVLLGVGWQRARAFVMRPLPQNFISHFPVIRSP
ncbi:MAG: hypothetical protein JNM20_07330 [Rhizobiales bacterium]|nr:hypothetical protein [Hyphomicrobiales bacterium]